MKKIFSLLGLLMLLFSSGVWAGTTTTTYTFEDENKVFTEDSRITAAIENNTDLNSKVVGFTCASNAQNGYSFAHFDFSSLVSKASTVTVDFDYYNTDGGRAIVSIGDATVRSNTGGSSKTTYNGTGAIFRLGSDKNNAILNGSNLAKSTYCNKWLHVNVVVDVNNKKVSYKITDAATSTEITSAQDVAYYNSSANSCSQIDLFGYINNSHCAMIDNLSITNYVDDSEKFAGYTIKYISGGVEIKNAVTNRDQVKVGTTATLIPADKDPIIYNNKKYVYVSDDSETQTIVENGSTVITVNFKEATSFTYSVNDNLGNELANGSAYEGDNVTFYVPYYAFKGGKFYQSPTLSSGTLSYGQGTLSAISANTNITVTYTEEANTKVVFYSEAEKLLGVTVQNDGYTNIRMSNGAAGYFADPTQVTSLQPGVYTLTAATRAGTTKFTVNGSKEILNLTSSGSVVTATSDEFVISKESAIVATAGNASNYFDYVIIRKTAEFVATDELTINEAEITIGETAKMTATLLPANATNKTLTWTIKESNSIDKGEAEIDAATGEITPLKAGLIAVEVTNGEKTDTKEFTIAAAQFDVTITGAPQEAQVFVGDDASVENKLYVSTKAGYDQMQTTSLLQPQGSVTATRIPTYIYSIAVDKSKKTIGVLYEEDIEVTAMNFEVTDQRIAQGNSRTLQVTYTPSNASFKTATWESSNPDVATVDPVTGFVTAKSEGTTTITATWSENESHGTDYSAQLTLTVDKGLVLDNIVYDEMEDGTAEVMGYYYPLSGDTLYLPSQIDSNGRMIPVSFIDQEAFIGCNLKSIVIPGTVKTIDHRALEYSNTHNAYNEGAPEDGMESAFLLEGVEVMRDRIFFGNKYMKKVFLPSTLKEIGYYSFDETAIEDVYYGGTEKQWKELDSLTNARYGEGAISFSKLPATAQIHFNSTFIGAMLSGISVEDDFIKMDAGEEYQIEVTVAPEQIADQVELTFTSSNEEIATVDENGVITAVADGFATITVSAGSGVETKVRVKVGNPSEKENLLTMTFEDGEVADYWAFSNEGSSLIEPAAEGSTGRAATIIATKDRGDYVKVNPDLSGVTKYEVSMDLLITKSPKTTQFSVLTNSSWDSWTHNYGMFWKTTSAQSHNSYLFNMNIPASNTAEINIDIDAAGEAVAAQQTWDYVNGTWYTLKLNVDVNAHTVEYTIAPKSDLTAVEVTGSYTVPADENMQIKGIYERNGRYNYEPGAIAIDNVIVDAVERGTVEGSDQLTGISEAQADKIVKSGKFVEKGQVVIYISGKKFNAAGQQVK